MMPAYGMAFSDGSGLFTAYNPGYPMSAAYAYGHAGVQPQPMWTAMSTGHQAPVTVPADAPFDISATGTYGRGSGSTKTVSADVDRIATRLGDLLRVWEKSSARRMIYQASPRRPPPRAVVAARICAKTATQNSQARHLSANTIAETSHGHVWAETDEMFDHSFSHDM